MTTGLLANLVLVGTGGAIGAMGRFCIGLISTKLLGWPFFSGTLIVNLIGSFAMGLLFAMIYSEKTGAMAYPWSPLLLTGILGGFTTFSAFSLEMLQLLQTGRSGLAIAYVMISVIGGLALVALGWSLMK